MSDITAQFAGIVGDHNLLTGDAIPEDYWHDEVLTRARQQRGYVAKPASTEEVAALLKVATEQRIPVTARGSGSGLSGAAVPLEGGGPVSLRAGEQGRAGRNHH